jgi:iron-sulfur cluster insertion protein
MISITSSALSKISDLLAEENNPKLKIRTFVQGGGCSGMSYGFIFDEEQTEEDFDIEGVLVDSISMQYLNGATIDYKDDLSGSQFVILNPNAQTTCGCGSSFSVE